MSGVIRDILAIHNFPDSEVGPVKKFVCLALACTWLTIQACSSGTSGSSSDGAVTTDSDGYEEDGGGPAGEDDGLAGDDSGPDGEGDLDPDAGEDADGRDGGSGDYVDAGGDTGYADGDGTPGGDGGGDTGPSTFVTVTFNVGIHPTVGTGGWTAQQNEYLDTYYGHGLCWGPAVNQARAFFDSVQPDIVTFQEIFDIRECENVPIEVREGFVCENWTPDSPTVEELILGPGYQVACNLEKTDKCAAVKRAFGSFRGCEDDYCPNGLYGSRVEGCGRGARIGRGVIDLVGGGTITLVNVHGSSGVSGDDADCRIKQIDQVFLDIGDGEPGANGAVNIIQGDFNTDPRSPTALALDSSARRWTDFVGSDKDFDFANEYVKTYNNLFCIDNVVTDVLTGECWYPGFTDGHPEVSPEGYFDHVPTVCTMGFP